MKTKMRNYLIAKVMKVKAAINNNKAEGFGHQNFNGCCDWSAASGRAVCTVW